MTLDLTLNTLHLERLPFQLHLLPNPAYLVGGAVRDALLGRDRAEFDLDLVLPKNAIAIARQMANHYQAGFVILDDVRHIARIVLPQGTIDVAEQMGTSIEQDLQRRDFRINAIAYELHSRQLIDPLGGIEDLQAGVIRMVARENLADDPLRILRAYRQAAQLHFTIKPKTRQALRKFAPKLRQVAGERIRQELHHLLSHPDGRMFLKLAQADGALGICLPQADEKRLAQLEQVEQVAWLLGRIWGELATHLETNLGQKGLSLLALAKLACLVDIDPEQASVQVLQLKYSRAEVQGITTVLRSLPTLLNALQQPLSLPEQYFFFQDVGELFGAAIVLAIATAASQQLMRETRAVGMVAPLVNAYLDPDNQVAHPTPLVTGKDLINALNVQTSPQIGQLLKN
jgi:tRNA nucleotidyltransferase (CCA-adding enzyme)